MCQRVQDEWWNQDLDFQTPDPLDDECTGVAADGYTDECIFQWEQLYLQCNDYTDTPYMWTDICDAQQVADKFAELWYGNDGIIDIEEEVVQLNLKRSSTAAE